MATLDDCGQWFGSDINLAPDGDVFRVNGPMRSQQRVLRRLLTNPGTYLSHPKYGAGIRRWVGRVINIPEITALVRGQMLLERSVSQNPVPTVGVAQTLTGVLVSIGYVALPDKQPVALTFTLPVTGG